MSDFESVPVGTLAKLERMREALKWADRQIMPYGRRIKGQNDAYCDGYDRFRAALED